MMPRLDHGLPRGGLGYLGLPLGLAAAVAALRLDGDGLLLFCTAPLPVCLWLALGLRRDGDEGEATDALIVESRKRNDWFGLKDHDVLSVRLSTLAILLGLSAPAIALGRMYLGR